MKKIVYICLLLYSSFCFSQDIFLTEVKSTNNNQDKFLYALEKKPDSSAQYLGKIEVSGFTLNDEDVFSEIYKKAKSIGSNSYVLKSPEDINGNSPFNPAHYFLYLYYIDSNNLPKQNNFFYLINPHKDLKVRLNEKKVMLTNRSFTKKELLKNEITDISVGNFLGSRIKLQYKDYQPEQYFMVSGKKISANSQVSPGINFKTGDIIKVEKSYALFLINIYKEIN